MNTPGDRSGGFGNRPDTGSPSSSLGSSGRSYSGADIGRGSSNISTGGDDDGGGQNRTSGVVRDQQGNVRNPYPNSFFSKIFGADNVSYQNIIPQNTLNQLGGMAEQRFNNPQMAVRGGFGKLFGGAEGEMTTAGPRVGGIREQTLGEGIAGLALGSIVPGAGMLERAGRTVYAPEGMLPEGYEQDQGGLLESLLGGFGGAVQPEPGTVGRAAGQLKTTASELLDQAKSGIRSLFPDAQADQMVNSVSSLDPRLQRDAMSQNMTPQPDNYDARVAEVLANLDPSKSISSDKTVGISDIIKGTDMTPVKTYDLMEPGVMTGIEQAGGGYKVQDIQEQLDSGLTGTFDSSTGKVQLSIPGTARGLSYDLGRELGLSSGFDFDSFMDTLSPDNLAAGMTQERVTGSGNFQEGPAFLKGINK
jgi:hypothetical protein